MAGENGLPHNMRLAIAGLSLEVHRSQSRCRCCEVLASGVVEKSKHRIIGFKSSSAAVFEATEFQFICYARCAC